jgi:DNA repair protein RecO (recombination protein O)
MSRAPRPTYRDEAFVLRTHRLGEADLILVLLTRGHGLVRGVAKGVRRTKSRFGSRLDRFVRVNVQVYPGRNRSKPDGGLATVTDAATVATYAPTICADVDRFYAGVAMLEIAGQVVQGADPQETALIFGQLDAALAALAGTGTPGSAGAGGAGAAAPPADTAVAGTLPPRTQADRMVLQALAVAGWAPSLVDCAQCGRPGPHRAFHPAAGGAVCVRCRPVGASTPDPQAVRVLWLLSHGRAGQVAEVAAGPGGSRILGAAHALLLGHVRYQTGAPCPAYAAL